MSSILKRIVIQASACLLLFWLLPGCARHHATAYSDGRQMSEAMEITGARVPPPPPEMPIEEPDEHVVSSAIPTTGRYADTQPAGYSPTRIVVHVGEHGVIRRAWPLEVNLRPSGDVLAGPTYWPTVDKAVHRPNSTNVWLEPLEFLYNVALLPYRVIDEPPWSKVVYSPSGGIDWSNVEQSGVIFQERNE